MQLRLSTFKEAEQYLKQLELNWKRSTDTNQLLAGLSALNDKGYNLLQTLAYQTPNVDPLARSNVKQCIELIQTLAQHDKTDIKALITLLSEVIPNSNGRKMNFSGNLYTNFHGLIDEYLNVVITIAKRDDVTPAMLQNLLAQQDERSKEKDGSFLFDLIESVHLNNTKYNLVKNYLDTLVQLADKGKIDADTIYAILRQPYGSKYSIGTLIASITNSEPSCYILLARLLRHLQNAKINIHSLLPRSYNEFKNHQTKEELYDYLENLATPQEQVDECVKAGDKNDPIGWVLYEARGLMDCDLDAGSLKRMTALLGRAIIRNNGQGASTATPVAAAAPIPSAPPPLTNYENEYEKLFQKLPPAEYIPASAQQLSAQDPTELGGFLRRAAGYGNKEELLSLLDNTSVDVNFCRDINDDCQDATPLYLACEGNHLENARALLQHGAKVDLARRNGMTPLCIAAANGDKEMVELLLERGAEINIFTREKNSPLLFAALQGHHEVVAQLVTQLCERYANYPDKLLAIINQHGNFKSCVEHAQNGRTLIALLKLTNFLAQKGVDKKTLNTMIPQTFTYKNELIKDSVLGALTAMTPKDRLALCNEILDDKDSLLYQAMHTKRDGGPLARNCRSGAGFIGMVEEMRTKTQELITELNREICLVIRAYAEAGYTDAAFAICKDRIAFALGQGADINAKHDFNINISRMTPLAIAANTGHVELVNFLLEHHADPAVTFVMRRQTLLKHMTRADLPEGDQQRIAQYLAAHYEDHFEFTPESYAELMGARKCAERLRAIREPLKADAQQLVQADPVQPINFYDQAPVSMPLYQQPPIAPTQNIYPLPGVALDLTAPVVPRQVYPATPAAQEPAQEMQAYIDAGSKMRVEATKKQVQAPARVPVNPFDGFVRKTPAAVPAAKPSSILDNPFNIPKKPAAPAAIPTAKPASILDNPFNIPKKPVAPAVVETKTLATPQVANVPAKPDAQSAKTFSNPFGLFTPAAATTPAAPLVKEKSMDDMLLELDELMDGVKDELEYFNSNTDAQQTVEEKSNDELLDELDKKLDAANKELDAYISLSSKTEEKSSDALLDELDAFTENTKKELDSYIALRNTDAPAETATPKKQAVKASM